MFSEKAPSHFSKISSIMVFSLCGRKNSNKWNLMICSEQIRAGRALLGWSAGELVSQMADAFWWVKIYRAEKNHLLVSEMADRVIT